MMSLPDSLLAVGAAARVTHFVVQDPPGGFLLRNPARRWAERGDSDLRFRIADGLECSWCVSMWASVATLAGYAAARAAGREDVWRFGAGVLSLAYAAGYLESHGQGDTE